MFVFNLPLAISKQHSTISVDNIVGGMGIQTLSVWRVYKTRNRSNFKHSLQHGLNSA